MYVWRKYVYKEKEESKYIVERKREENAADNYSDNDRGTPYDEMQKRNLNIQSFPKGNNIH